MGAGKHNCVQKQHPPIAMSSGFFRSHYLKHSMGSDGSIEGTGFALEGDGYAVNGGGSGCITRDGWDG
jgi:hypothetical protein